MKDFDALKNIWMGQAVEPTISPEEILKRVKKTKRNFANKLLIEIAAGLVVIVFFGFIWVKSPFMMWTTHLSMFIFLACCFYYLSVQIADYKSINDSSLLLKQPEEYIEYLKDYRKSRYILNTRKYRNYSIFIGIGFAFYFVEVYFVAALWHTVLGVAFTLAWFLVCWYLMKNYIKREEEKLGEMIDGLERLEKQFKSEV